MPTKLPGFLRAVLRQRGRLFAVMSLFAAAASLLLSVKLAPWLYAMNVHVRLHMQAPAETRIEICWDRERTQCLPLVPYSSAAGRIAQPGETADLWLSELPPRPQYLITLILRSNVNGAIFQDLELDPRNFIIWGWLPGIGFNDTKISLTQMNVTGITFVQRNAAYYVNGEPGDRLAAVHGIQSGSASSSSYPIRILMIAGLLFSFYLLLAIPLFLFPFAVRHAAIAIREAPPRRYPWWAFLLCGLAVLLMLVLVDNSPVMLASDSMFYLPMAIRGDWLNPARPPGYWVFLAPVLWATGNNLGGVVLVQAICLCSAVATSIWALRRWIHPFLAVLTLVAILFSPSQIRWALFILRESLFASLVLFAVSAVIAHFGARNAGAARLWLVVFSVVSGLALLVRENGVILPAALLPVVLPAAVRRLGSPGTIRRRISSAVAYLGKYALPLLSTTLVYLAFCVYHFFAYGYFQFTLFVTSHHFLWMEQATASFDPRSLLDPAPSMSTETRSYLGQRLYNDFVLYQEEHPALDPIIGSLWPTLNQMMSDRGLPINWFYSAGIIDEIGRSAWSMLPWKTGVAGVVRQYADVLLATGLDPTEYKLQPDGAAGLAAKEAMLSQLDRPVTYTGRPSEPFGAISEYFHIPIGYDWYLPLFYLALLSGLYLLRLDHPVFVVPLALFMANAFLMLLLRTETSRYLRSLDVLLILQVALAASRWLSNRLPPGSRTPYIVPQ